jgi:hypothetical protein
LRHLSALSFREDESGVRPPHAKTGSRFSVCLANAVDQLPEILDRLHATQPCFPVGDKRRYATHAQARRIAFIFQDTRSKFMTGERRPQRITVEPQPKRDRDQHLRVADVFASLKEGAKEFVVIIVKATLRARPVRRVRGFTGGNLIVTPSRSASGATESVQTRRK